jgi:transcription elongation factor Elf1
MTDYPFICPECKSDRYSSSFLERDGEVRAALTCLDCAHAWTVTASYSDFQRL